MASIAAYRLAVTGAVFLLSGCGLGFSSVRKDSGKGAEGPDGAGNRPVVVDGGTATSGRVGMGGVSQPVLPVVVPGAADCIQADEFVCKAEMEILRLTNEERARRGRQPLVNGKRMAVVARLWSAQQARRGFIGHDGFPRGRERVYAENFPNADVDMSAENVAMTGGADDDPMAVAAEFYEMWRYSPGHYANMIGDYDMMGVGLAKSGRGGWYATEVFGRE